MAPKKKQQQSQNNNTKKGGQKKKVEKGSSSSSGPKLQISAENEQRLRRLLLNSSSRPSPAPSVPNENISKSQKAKRLRTIYEKLSCEGFTSDQIERALSAVSDGPTFEDALDWLCFNLSGNELPLKFSSGASTINEGGSISIISTARDDWVPSPHLSTKNEGEMPGVPVRLKVRQDDATLDLQQHSQADWIRQYVEQQEEDEWEALASDVHGSSAEASDPSSRADSIVKEYSVARLEAMDAKAKGDKKRQEQAGSTIRKLKQEMSALGLSDDILVSGFLDEFAFHCVSKDAIVVINIF